MVLDVDGVIRLDKEFDTQKIRGEWERLMGTPEALTAYATFKQVGLVCRPQASVIGRFADAGGSLLKNEYSLENAEWSNVLYDTKDFTRPTIEEDAFPYLSQIVMEMRDLAGTYGRRIGRIRFMTQVAKTCLSYHRDTDECRFHIPVKTHRNAFFVVDDKVCRMEREGAVYLLNTKAYHTAVNAHKASARTHLVFDTFKTTA